MARAVTGIEIIFHQAALNSNPRSIKEPGPTNAVNVGGTLLLLEAARQAGVRRLVYASSSSVYGELSPVLPKTEDLPLLPKAPYGVSKLAAELYCRVFAEVYGIETVSLRYFNVFGPRQRPYLQYAAVIPRFPAADVGGATSGDLRRWGAVAGLHAGGQRGRGELRAAAATAGIGGAFNVACGQPSTLNQLVAWLNAELGTDLPPVYEPIRKGTSAIRMPRFARPSPCWDTTPGSTSGRACGRPSPGSGNTSVDNKRSPCWISEMSSGRLDRPDSTPLPDHQP